MTGGLHSKLRRHRTRTSRAAGCVVCLVAVLAGCSSHPPAELATAATQPTPTDHELLESWRETTETTTRVLLDDARALAEAGDLEAALDRVDDALCMVLDPPEEIADQPEVGELIAALLTEAEELERSFADIRPDDEPLDIVVLPPIELPEAPDDAAPAVDPNGLPLSDYPLVLNGTVERFLDAMTGEGEYRQRVSTGLARSGPYLPMIRGQLADAGLPEDIAYLPLIESAFSLKATSRARAHGMWQFISATGRHYGLEIGSLVDERRDPVRSTEAAVAYLGDLYREFNDWHLALAAYNSGAGNVRRAIRRSGSRDFWTLRRYLPRETRNYVPAFIASVIVAKDPERWGFPVPDERPWILDRVEVPDALDLQFLADRTGLDIELLRDLNPAIRRDLTPARRTTWIWLPTGDGQRVVDLLAATPTTDWAPRMIHTVRRGESLSTIASRYGSSVGAIKQANGLRGSLIHPGQNLLVPRLGVTHSRPVERRADAGGYVVQSNDTLWDIARAFGVTVDALCAANGLTRRDVIRPGQRLQLPAGTGGPAAGGASSHAWSGSYTVRSGDTLSGIASRYRVSVTELRRANGLSGSRIYPGTALTVPGGADDAPAQEGSSSTTTYRVRRGDTLYDIARQFGVSVSELRRLNGLSGSRIYPGDVLRIPTRQARG